MPRRDDLHSILIIGSGPIIIGQACEFDYSGTQACKALREEGYRVVLINSNPATIMTDPEFADRTYIEPVTAEAVIKIIEAEHAAGTPIDALLPTLGGQTGLNTAVEVADSGILEQYGVAMIGANREAIHRAEDRRQFAETMRAAGLDLPRGSVIRAEVPKRPRQMTRETLEVYEEAVVKGIEEAVDKAEALLDDLGLPCVIRPSFTLGGHGGGVAYTVQQFREIVARGLEYSHIHEVLIEESLIGWKEYEMEVMRDHNDNVVIICSIENFDPMGVHTGDSITVAPSQTLTDKEYQRMRDASVRVIRAIGVETGGSNIQFAIDPKTGRMVVIEMNPRVSRSSALASKATGFPIAKIAAKLAVGYSLDEIRNDITRETPACFEPTIDYCVVKIPRWTFEKFPEADESLTTQMKSVGEAMSIGRTFKESLQKGIRSMEIRRYGLGLDPYDKYLRSLGASDQQSDSPERVESIDGQLADEQETAAVSYPIPQDVLHNKLTVPCQGRLYYIRYALRMGYTIEQIYEMTGIDPWFLQNLYELVQFEQQLCECASLDAADADLIRQAKQLGYSDVQLATVWQTTADAVRSRRKELHITPVYKLVDTCAAEFEAYTPYYYSSYEVPSTQVGATTITQIEDEVRVTDKPKVVILGGGPNRIGQGIEFDYCCVHAAFAVQQCGYEAIMVNSNPETVSTDYDTSDLLFFEPLTAEDVLNLCERLGPSLKGMIVQFGGQTPLNLSNTLWNAGVPIIGTSPRDIWAAEDREQFSALLKRLHLRQPDNGTATNVSEAMEVAHRVGYPVLVRPGFVLGGRGMEIVYDDATLRTFMQEAAEYSERPLTENPVLLDKFLQTAIEVDVDAVSDGERVIVAGIMEHIEEAGIHSGDSACALPPYSLAPALIDQIKESTIALAKGLHVVGLMNVQYAIRDDQIIVLEVNPRASRTVPFVSKATGTPWAKVAAMAMLGKTLDEQGVSEPPPLQHTAVKESVFPFAKFPGVDVILGPEMRSTGEVMGIDQTFPMAFAKSQIAANATLPTHGNVFVSVRDADKEAVVPIARRLVEMDFNIITTAGTRTVLEREGIASQLLPKIQEGKRPNIMDLIAHGQVSMIINTPTRKGRATDEGVLRGSAVMHSVPMITTITGARAAVQAIAAMRDKDWTVKPIQQYHQGNRTTVNPNW